MKHATEQYKIATNGYACDSDRDIHHYRGNRDAVCYNHTNIDNKMIAQAVRNQFATTGIDLEEVSDRAILVYYRIKDKKLRLRVRELISTTLKTHTDLMTGKPFNDPRGHTLTEPLMKDLVKLGRAMTKKQIIAERQKPAITRLTDAEVETLGRMKASAIKSTTPQAGKSDILALYIKLTGI